MDLTHELVALRDRETGEIVYSVVRHRVGECPLCDRKRAARIGHEFLDRLDASGVPYESLHMWSLGCSLRDSRSNRKVLSRWWREFCESMKRTGWVPCFRVLESGRRGFIHLHVVVSGYVEHGVVLSKWRAVTGEKSNVHVSSMTGGPGALVSYLIKYVTKTTTGGGHTGSYRWLGPLYGIKRTRLREGGRSFEYMGSTCYSGPKCKGYRVPSIQRKID